MNRFTVLLATIICIVLTGCQAVVVREKIEVSATITKMQYEASYTTRRSMYNPATKTMMPRTQTHSAQYLVTISYEDISETFNDQTLYEAVKEGDIIQMILCKSYDEDGKLIKQTLQFSE